MPPRKLLKPEEVKEEWREYYDYDRQEVHQGALYIWGRCPRCGVERWRSAACVRAGKPKTALCNPCARATCNGPILRGPDHSCWKGGRFFQDGYVRIHLAALPMGEQQRFQPMAMSAGYLSEHRLVIARHLGRPLRDDEIVHHINGVRDDNRYENLKLLARNTHHSGKGDNYYQQLQEALSEIERLKEQLRAIQAG